VARLRALNREPNGLQLGRDYLKQKGQNVNTLEKIIEHARELIERGGPFTKNELAIIKMATPSKGKANSGTRWNSRKQKVSKRDKT